MLQKILGELPKQIGYFLLLPRYFPEGLEDATDVIAYFLFLEEGCLEEVLFSYDDYKNTRYQLRIEGRGENTKVTGIKYLIEDDILLHEIYKVEYPIEEIHTTIPKFLNLIREDIQTEKIKKYYP